MSRFLRIFRGSTSNPTPNPMPDRRYGCKVLYDNENATVDILFVHGLTGDRISTWTAENNVCWPRDLLNKTIPEARVIVFGYDADVANFWSPASQNTIDEHAQTLVNNLGILREKDQTSDRPLILIGHSLGGLVIQNALLISWSSVEQYRRKLYRSTRAILFLGTPHCGSTMASWAEFGSNIVSVVKTTNKKLLTSLTTGSEVLSVTQDRFHTLLRRLKEEDGVNITLVCFYEELYVSWIGKKVPSLPSPPLSPSCVTVLRREVVPDTSARISGYVAEGIHANHMDMTKFADVEDPGFEKVSNQIWLCLRGMETKGAAEQVLYTVPSGGNGGGGGSGSKYSVNSFHNIVNGDGSRVGL